MSLLSRLNSLARVYLHRSETEAADEEELRSYVELLTASNIRDGASAEEAQRAALVELGGIEQVREQVREVRIGFAVENLARDIDHARRSLWKNRGFSLVASLTIALGVGFGGAIFSLIASVLLRPLSFPDPDRLVTVSRVQTGSVLEVVPYPIYRDWRSAQRVFAGLAAHVRADGVFAGEEGPARAAGRMVSADFFSTLGVVPALGRFFTEAEDAPGGERVLILGHEFWRDRFRIKSGHGRKDDRVQRRVLARGGSSAAEFRFLRSPQPPKRILHPARARLRSAAVHGSEGAHGERDRPPQSRGPAQDCDAGDGRDRATPDERVRGIGHRPSNRDPAFARDLFRNDALALCSC